jgi:hypothetical protein
MNQTERSLLLISADRRSISIEPFLVSFTHPYRNRKDMMVDHYHPSSLIILNIVPFVPRRYKLPEVDNKA